MESTDWKTLVRYHDEGWDSRRAPAYEFAGGRVRFIEGPTDYSPPRLEKSQESNK